VYRDKSKSKQVIYFGIKEEKEKIEERKTEPKYKPKLRLTNFVEASETYSGGCTTCNL